MTTKRTYTQEELERWLTDAAWAGVALILGQKVRPDEQQTVTIRKTDGKGGHIRTTLVLDPGQTEPRVTDFEVVK